MRGCFSPVFVFVLAVGATTSAGAESPPGRGYQLQLDKLTPDMVPDGIKPFRFRARGHARRGGKMYLNSWSFADGGPMPRYHSCLDRSISPPVHIGNVPAQARSTVLILEDLDVKHGPSPTRVHWLVYNIPPEHDNVIEGMGGIYWGGIAFCCGFPFNSRFEAKRGKNDFGYNAYTGICPRDGRHRYRITVYAINRLLPDLHEPEWPVVRQMIQGHILDQASYYGTFDTERHPYAP